MNPLGNDDAGGGDRERLERLYALTRQQVANYVARRCEDPTDRQDVLSEVYLTAWRRLRDAPHQDDLAQAWVVAIARRVLANHLRAGRRRTALNDKVRSIPTSPMSPREESPRPDVLEALNRLGENDREILTLLAWDDLSPQQIAVVLQVRPGTVRVRLHRARERFTHHLAIVQDETRESPAAFSEESIR